MALELSESAKNLQLGIYRHYKGPEYEIMRVVYHSETLEELVLYRKLNDNSYWVRPLSMFLENIEVGDQLIPRFKYIRALDE